MMNRRTSVALILMVLVVGSSLAQSDTSQTRVYPTKWRTAAEIQEILQQVVSSANGRISGSDTFNAVTVAGTPELHQIVADILERYDRPPTQFELRFYILRATEGEDAGTKPAQSSWTASLPESVRGILEEVSEVIRYDRFELVAAPVLRLTPGRSAYLSGDAIIPYGIEVGGSSVFDQDDKSVLRVGSFSGTFRSLRGEAEPAEEGNPARYRTAQLKTSFTIADGETLVLGVSQLASSSSEEIFSILAIVEAHKMQ